ncbi:Tape measure protein [Mycolicibacterium canariasense]|uniref:Tape measure protein n=1 Tax=Mycolicibacterium canariasense TaxID=228230 RepID=A0A100WIT6_MYCCR|nr:hypothetical protein [Mycolicibacterium canariasense]MCV7210170.1 hypothetical protein [Mycolicibacterium canariasense]ORU97873.1 hypothetical protein AWB94_29420 [Mycolicibacterium canariasense]GAS98818.1 Tape measure protein [Mycolicibacterium canariasense]
MGVFDDGGPVSGQGEMPRSTTAPEVRFTDEQRAALRRMGVDEGDVRPGSDPLGARRAEAFADSVSAAQGVIQRLAADRVRAQMGLREGLFRGHLVELVRAEIERCHDESIDYTTTAESVVGVFVEVLRNPPTLVTDVDGVTRVEPS